MRDTFGDLLSGGGGFALGAIAAGLTPAWAVEADSAIADCYERNIGPHVIRQLVQDVDYSKLPRVYHLHMSPICTNASTAKTGAGETADDLAIADACARAIRELLPVTVSLENVYPYRKFDSFRRICRALSELGYNFRYWHLNSADYGVPQTRKRLILLASHERDVRKPQPTHIDPAKIVAGHGSLFGGGRLPWRGWFEAIEDLIPTLPESRFSRWQELRLEKIFNGKTYEERSGSLPRGGGEPVFTLTGGNTAHGRVKAFLVDGQNAGRSVSFRDAAEPSISITNQSKAFSRAFIVDCQEAGTANENGERGVTVRHGDAPVFTVSAHQNENSMKRPLRAWLEQGRVVAMTPLALARFQSVTDVYVLPDKAGLACRIIGNMVPPLMAEYTLRGIL